MNYFLIALITTSGAAVIIYFLLNRFSYTKIQPLPLILCAACSLFLSLALPKFIIRYTDLMGTLAVLAFFSLLFAYFLAYYDEKFADKQVELEESGNCLLHTVASSETVPDEVAATLLQNESNADEDEQERCCTNSCNVVNEQNPIPEFSSCIACIDPVPHVEEDADTMLDRAFRLKELRDFNQAAKLFQAVLHSNIHSSAASLILLEIADALCHCGEWEAAKTVLFEGLHYPAVMGTLGEKKIRAMIADLEQHQESESHGGSNSEEES